MYNSWQEPSWTKSDLIASLDIDLNGTFHKDFNVLDLTNESEFPRLTTSSSDLIFQTCMQPERKCREFTDRQNVSRESGVEEICGPFFRSHSNMPRQKKTQKRLYKGPYQPVESQTFLPRTYTKKKSRPTTTHSNLDDKTNCFTSLTAQRHLSDLSNDQHNVCQSVLDSAELLCSNTGPPQVNILETCKKTSMGDTKTDKKLKQRQRKRRQKHYIDMRPTVFSECPNDETLSVESSSPKNDIWAYATISVILPIDTPSSSSHHQSCSAAPSSSFNSGLPLPPEKSKGMLVPAILDSGNQSFDVTSNLVWQKLKLQHKCDLPLEPYNRKIKGVGGSIVKCYGRSVFPVTVTLEGLPESQVCFPVVVETGSFHLNFSLSSLKINHLSLHFFPNRSTVVECRKSGKKISLSSRSQLTPRRQPIDSICQLLNVYKQAENSEDTLLEINFLSNCIIPRLEDKQVLIEKDEVCEVAEDIISACFQASENNGIPEKQNIEKLKHKIANRRVFQGEQE